MDLSRVLRETAREAASLEKKLPDHVPGQVLVKTRPDMALDSLGLLASDYGARVIERFEVPEQMKAAFNGELIQLKLAPGMSVAQAIAAISKDERVEYADTNATRKLYGSAAPVLPNDLDPALWGLNNTGQNGGTADADIDAPEAWAVSRGSRQGAVIAVIDTGIDYNHPDLAANVWTNPNEIPGDGIDNDNNGVVDDVHGYNAAANDGNPLDDNSHGSHCTGTIGAVGNNEQGVVGVNWEAQIMGVKFLSANGGGTVADVVKSVFYATRNGAKITSNSYGGGADQAERDAFAASPILHICAAGNESSDNDVSGSFPATYDLDNIVSVAASDRNDRLASFSNWGATTVDLAAPGVDIKSTIPGGGYASYSGTSMATPHVAGVAGLIATVYPEATPAEIKARLMNGVDPIPDFQGKMISGGRLNAFNSLENDTVAPAAPNDFRGTGATSRSATLSWTATADDGWCGNAANGYQLRVSDRPIVDGEAAEGQVSFEQAASVPTGRPGQTGTIEQAAVSLVPSSSERTLHFALKVTDNVGNASEIRTASVTVPAASVAFEDTMDQSNDNWTPDAGWALVQVDGRTAWTDSPEGEYGNDRNSSLTSRPISLAGLRGSTLIFESKYDLEARYDGIHVEVARIEQPGQGEPPAQPTWTELARFDGSSDWSTRSLDLSAYDGQQVQLRFRLTSDSSVGQDGFYLDNLVIAGDPNQ
ncbi:MAG: S8 family serine peptidase [Armatimonadetes bacterium]|nr:S8 family serine peptidase [Armatimonadota bacterium]